MSADDGYSVYILVEHLGCEGYAEPIAAFMSRVRAEAAADLMRNAPGIWRVLRVPISTLDVAEDDCAPKAPMSEKARTYLNEYLQLMDSKSESSFIVEAPSVDVTFVDDGSGAELRCAKAVV